MENKVLNRGELQRLGEEVDHIVKRTGDLVYDLIEKMQMAGKIFKDHFFNPKKQLSLRSHLETENDESESTESSSSLTESEDESEKSRDEEKVESAQALALPPTVGGDFLKGRNLYVFSIYVPENSVELFAKLFCES
ncbi:caspase-12-like isoform X2 [Pseudorca crassidens]|uniref:caspase-12-like isoform X2 n=1 Tax=Pseudorca crassidens TaxID=82174 RepID=UPI00352C9C41